MRLPPPTAVFVKIARAAYNNGLIRIFLSKPVTWDVFYSGLRLVHGDTFKLDIGGVRFIFYSPHRPYDSETYLTTFITKPYYEHSVVMHLQQVIKSFTSPTFLDVGAHFGYYTIYMSKLGGPSSKIYSFEPNSDYIKILSRNVRLNNLRNVSLHQIALSDRKGTATMEASKRFRSAGFVLGKRRMRKVNASDTSSDEQVLAIPFDELAESAGIRPDIVKIDVHGAEGNVIAGMKRALGESVSHLYCELHDEMRNEGYSVRDIVDMLRDAGMQTFEFGSFRSQNGQIKDIPENIFSKPADRMVYARK